MFFFVSHTYFYVNGFSFDSIISIVDFDVAVLVRVFDVNALRRVAKKNVQSHQSSEMHMTRDCSVRKLECISLSGTANIETAEHRQTNTGSASVVGINDRHHSGNEGKKKQSMRKRVSGMFDRCFEGGKHHS